MRVCRVRKLKIPALLVLVCLSRPIAPAGEAAPPDRLQAISQYIAAGWDRLTRSTSRCESVVDPKRAEAAVLYVPADYAVPEPLTKMQTQCGVTVKPLPFVIHGPGEVGARKISPAGLLFLGNAYVVPGGRFNEMYGWDSYFIVLGLLRDHRLELAEGMVRNFFFEIDHYGAILNANRTYYLTRSQPPFLSSMVMAIYQAEKSNSHDSAAWLAEAYPYVEKDYQMWTRSPHLAGSTGLSRYYDFGEGPAPESLDGEPGYYRKVAAYFLRHPQRAREYIVEGERGNATAGYPRYTVQICDTPQTPGPDCETVRTVQLAPDYFKGDRAMRESGFDPSFRFGPYGAATEHYAPVCLNSLLYKTEKDMEEISLQLGRKPAAARWKQLASQRAARIRTLLWDPTRGMFFDYDLRSGRRSDYAYATTFYPLWAGLATAEEAKAVVGNLHRFEQPGGLAMSTRETGVQWDYPYGWAPIQWLAAEGLRRYGYDAEANRISYEFLSTVLDDFQRDGTIREKYNVVTRSSDVQVTAGYAANVVGFGWTNGVFLDLLGRLPGEWVERLRREPAMH
ncbi:MAG: trehalase family glycosidase [Terriglobales bacterium]